MKHIYLIRHGQTDLNSTGIMQGQSINTGLNEFGRDQIKQTAEMLKKYPIEMTYASPLLRARESGEIVAGSLGTPLKIIEDLKECNLGIFEGEHISKMQEIMPDTVDKWLSGEKTYFHMGLPDGEKKSAVAERLYGVFRTLANGPHTHIAVVSHGMAIRCIRLSLGLPVYRVPNGHFFHIILNQNMIQFENEPGVGSLNAL